MNILRKVRQFVSKHGALITDVLIITAVSLISVTWFKGSYLIGIGDFLFEPDRIATFTRGFYVWDAIGIGDPNFRVIVGPIPVHVIRAFTQVIGMSLLNSEKLWIWLNFAFMGLSMYYLASCIFKGKGHRIACLFASLFFMMNPYVAITLFRYGWLTYTFLPLKLGLFIKGLNERKGLKFALFVVIIWLLTTTNSYANPAFAIIDWSPLLAYLVFYCLLNRDKTKVMPALRFTGQLLLLWIGINFFWLLSTSTSLAGTIAQSVAGKEGVGVNFAYTFMHDSAPIFEAMRLLGYWGLESGVKGFPFFQWSAAYSEPLFLFIGALLPILAFGALMFRRGRKHILFFAMFALTTLFLMTGPLPPLGEIKAWLFDHIPLYGAAFVCPYLNFGMFLSLSYAILIGSSLGVLYSYGCRITQRFRKYSVKAGTGALFFLLIGIYAFPFWTGDVIYPGNEAIPSYRYQIPSYYFEARDWLDKQKGDFNILPIPGSKLGAGRFATWEPFGYASADPTGWLLGKRVITQLTSTTEMPAFAAELLKEGGTEYLGKIFALMNVKYILLHRDVDFEELKSNSWFIATSLERHQEILNNQVGIELEKSFGELDFYRNKYWKPSRIYATNALTFGSGGRDMLVPLSPLEALDPPSVIFLSDLNAQQSVSALEKAEQFVSYKQGDDCTLTAEKSIDYQHEGEQIDFENGFGSWLTKTTNPDSIIRITDADSQSGTHCAEGILSGKGSSTHIYKDFLYNGKSSINISGWLKVVSRESPGGAFIYIQGYDADGIERVRLNYYTYDNWDIDTSTPEENGQTFYVLRTHLGDPEYDKWTSVNLSPKNEFEAQFPGVWEKLNLAKIRVDLWSWTDGSITSRYDDFQIGGYYTQKIMVSSTYDLSIPKDGDYELDVNFREDFDEVLLYKIDNSRELQVSPEIYAGSQTTKLGDFWLSQGKHTITFIYQHEGEQIDFENGFGSWVTQTTNPASIVRVTDDDSHSGTYCAEGILNGSGSAAHIYKDFLYNGKSSIDISGWLKVVSRESPGGAFIYIQGYDADGIERVRLNYYTYDNWDIDTSMPEENGQTFYVLRTHLGDPEYDKWTSVDLSPKGEFEVQFPGVWERLNLTKIKVDLWSWTDGSITSRYDDFMMSGASVPPIKNLYAYSGTGKKASYTPNITFNKLNPTKYQVHVKATEPIFLVLSESYDPQWMAYINRAGNQTNWIQAFYQKPVPDDNHFLVNGYSNVWYIDKTGEYDVTLYFKPQSLYYIGVTISVLTFVASIGYLGWRRGRKNRLVGKG